MSCRSRRWALAQAVLLLAGGGCMADGDLSLLIIQNQIPEDGCVIPGTSAGEFRGLGVLDLDGPENPGYVFTPLVKNGTVGDQENPNQNVVTLQGANVELKAATTSNSIRLIEGASGGTLPLLPREHQLRTPLFSGSVSPNGGTTGLAFFAIDADQANIIRTTLASQGWTSVQVVARVQVFGLVDGATYVKSPPFDYPISLCAGCLIRNLGPCSAIPMGTPIETGHECNPYQDGRVDCCTLGEGLLCPAPVATTEDRPG